MQENFYAFNLQLKIMKGHSQISLLSIRQLIRSKPCLIEGAGMEGGRLCLHGQMYFYLTSSSSSSSQPQHLIG